MGKDYIIYQKFTDIESAEEFASELGKNGVTYLLQDNNEAYVKIVGYTTVDFAIGVNIKSEDFPKADKILENYYETQIRNIDSSYYLFEFTDHELKDIISNPFEWGRLDFQLAKYILKERGLEISETEIETIKFEKIAELSQKEKVNKSKIIMGYISAFVVPIFPILIGLTIKYNRKILPNGEKFYIHTQKDRNHGQRIIMISLIWSFLLFVYDFFIKN